MQRLSKLCTASFIALILGNSACTTANYVNSQAMTGAFAGTALGAGAGAIWGNVDDDIDPTKAAALLGSIGGGLGLLTGAYSNMQDENIVYETRVLRVPYEEPGIIAAQEDIDQLRRDHEEATKWGASETLSWEERYWGEESNIPYQGPAR